MRHHFVEQEINEIQSVRPNIHLRFCVNVEKHYRNVVMRFNTHQIYDTTESRVEPVSKKIIHS